MDDAVIETLPPAEAFALVGDETRFAILEALAEADASVAFTELRERVGVRDSGQFNYHLRKLDGRFVAKDDGYRLTPAGRRLVGAVLSGGFTAEFDADPVPLDAGCPRCDTALAVRFEESRVFVVCDDCDYHVVHVDVPPAVVEDYERDAVPGVVDRWIKRFVTSLDYGICPFCDGRIDRSVPVRGDPDAPDWVAEYDYPAGVRDACRRCGFDATSGVPVQLLHRPAVVAFYHDHGVDLREQPLWAFDFEDDSTARVTARDPLRLAVDYHADGDTLTLTLDADLTVLDSRVA